MNKLVSLAAVGGASLFGVLAVMGAMHFRDSAEVPRWEPPSPALAMPLMPPPQPEPAFRAAPPPRPAPVPPRPAPAPAQVAQALAPPVVVAPPPPVAPPVVTPVADPENPDLDAMTESQRRQFQAAEESRLRRLDMARNRRMMHNVRIPPQMK
jgi:hypothetical protein